MPAKARGLWGVDSDTTASPILMVLMCWSSTQFREWTYIVWMVQTSTLWLYFWKRIFLAVSYKYSQHIPVETIQTVYVDLHLNALHSHNHKVCKIKEFSFKILSLTPIQWRNSWNGKSYRYLNSRSWRRHADSSKMDWSSSERTISITKIFKLLP